MNIEKMLSTRTQYMKPNALREILKVVAQEGMISLAGGNPAPESFPVEIIRQLTGEVFDRFGVEVLQYDKTEGFNPLREALIGYLSKQGLANVSHPTLMIFSGSQSILDIAAKVLISPGDKIAIEAPSYLGAIAAFNAYQPDYISVPTDDEGMIPEALEAVLQQQRIKLIYLMPNFQNPTGSTLPLARRKQIAELIKKYDVLLLEDDPYRALRYSGQALPSIQQFAPEHVIYSGTFSKILAPGLRIGYCIAPAALSRWFVIAKQATDLHTQTFGQAVAALYLADGYLDTHLPHIIELYRARRDAMLEALASYMPDGFRWSRPDGGMFLWVQGPDGLDAERLYKVCVQQGVAFVPGKYCYIEEGKGLETLRLNFTKPTDDEIVRAVEVIAAAAEEFVAIR